MFPAASSDSPQTIVFTNQLCFSHLPLRARFAPNKASHFQRMESKALESLSSYHVSCQQGIQGLLRSQYINTALLTPWLLKQKSRHCCYCSPLQQAVHEQCWDFYSASQQAGQDSFQSDLLSRVCITKLDSCFLQYGLPPVSPSHTS